jgi:hypothetical protein
MAQTSSVRVAYSPGEFAALFGRSQTWGYRQIYAGKVNAITEHGRILIPAKDVEKVLESAGIYNGKEKPRQQKARVDKLSREEQGIWQRFLASRRNGQPSKAKTTAKAAPGPSKPSKVSRSSEMRRVSKAWAKH